MSSCRRYGSRAERPPLLVWTSTSSADASLLPRGWELFGLGDHRSVWTFPQLPLDGRLFPTCCRKSLPAAKGRIPTTARPALLSSLADPPTGETGMDARRPGDCGERRT